MIDVIMFYVFGLFVVAALTYLAIWMLYEKSLKAIEQEEKLAQPQVSPLALNVRTLKRFGGSYPVAGFVYRVSFFYMLAAAPGIFILMVLEYIV